MAGPESVYRTARPAPVLAPYVERYVGYRLVGFPPGLHRGLPSRHLTCIVAVGDPIDVVAQPDRRQAPDAYRFVLSGLAASPATIAHRGDQEGVALALTPLGCRALFGLPARALWSTTVEASDVAGRVGEELWERVQAGRWEERFAACDEVLTRLLRRPDVPRPVLHAWDGIVASGGTVDVASLADDVGWSRQHLARRFADEFGCPPKTAARVVRFERARRLVQSTWPRRTLADIAAHCGYFDQAHLHRDTVALAGCAPSELVEDVPSFQDDDDAAARSSTA